MLEILNEGRSDVSNSSSLLIILTFNVHFRRNSGVQAEKHT